MSNHNQNWAFGMKAGLDFSTTPPTSTTTKIGTAGATSKIYEGCAALSDANGNLLFYTDGITIWDGIGNVKYSGLKGNFSSTQSAICVPNPYKKDQYYIFTMDGSTRGSTINPIEHFNGVLIDTSTPNWVIDPINVGNAPSYKDLSPCEKITAVHHANCKDFWIVTVLQKGVVDAKNGEGVFRIYKVDSNGISFVRDQEMNAKIPEAGYLKGSQNSKILALANTHIHNVLVYSFDNSNGMVDISSQKMIKTPEVKPYGIEFSPNSELLYYSVLAKAIYNTSSNDTSTANLYQVDLSKQNLVSTPVHEFTNKGGGAIITGIQLGPDGKIYISKDREASLGAVLDPNNIGTACNVDPDYIKLQPKTTGRYGLPNIIPNSCNSSSENGGCGCGCEGCNEDHETLNAELIDRAKGKFNLIKAIDSKCDEPFMESCTVKAFTNDVKFEPCFYFHWGDSKKDQIEEHDSEVFYLTVCNTFSDVKFRGLKITKVSLIPGDHPIEKVHIVPDRFISLDCLESCSCEVREFAMINRAYDTAGDYKLHVEYCFDEVVLSSVTSTSGSVDFPLEITED